MEGVSSRPMTPADWPAVEAVYRAGIATGHATFEAEPPPDWEVFAAGKRPDLMLVAVDANDRVLGWAAAGPVSARPVYRGVVEHSVYVAPVSAGRGVGSRLLGDFLALADRSDIPGGVMSSRGGGLVCPGDCRVVWGVVHEAAVQDADEAVGKLA